jgi:transposase
VLTWPAGTKVFVCTRATDMRCGFDTLAAQVTRFLDQDPLSGHLFVFRSRRGDRLKVLYWDTDGYALWCKKQESDCPYSFAFTGFGELAYHLAARPASVGAVDSRSPVRDSRRRSMPPVATAVVPPRAYRPRRFAPGLGIG